MAHLRYKFNAETLLFERARTSNRKRLTRILRGFLLSTLLSMGYYVLYSQYFDTPHSLALRRSNAELAVKYDLLNKRFDEASNYLTAVQRRDNNVYRATFGVNTIPLSVRDAGFGGVDRYADFEKSAYSALLTNTSRKLDILLKKAYVQSVSFDTIEKLALQAELMVDCIPIIPPIAFKGNIRMTSGFSYRVDPIYGDIRHHNGLDFAGPIGTPIVVTGNGKVVDVEYSFFNYGNNILIDHGFGYKTRYAHLRSIDVKIGQTVKRGEKIAALGNTGKSNGPHLHYEVIYLGRPVNPINYFNSDIDPIEYEKILQAAQGMKEFD